jgi:phospholipid/cholesterol/gamma-HCH transport system substrate-binding protein
MSRRGAGEWTASLVVLMATGGFVAYAAAETVAPRHQPALFEAKFTSTDGLAAGADVVIAGCVVGKVRSVRLDPKTMLSAVTFGVDGRISLPIDTGLRVEGGGPTGASILEIEHGTSHEMLASGATVTKTASQPSLEQVIGSYIFGDAGLSE